MDAGSCRLMKQWNVMGLSVNFRLTRFSSIARYRSFYCVPVTGTSQSNVKWTTNSLNKQTNKQRRVNMSYWIRNYRYTGLRRSLLVKLQVRQTEENLFSFSTTSISMALTHWVACVAKFCYSMCVCVCVCVCVCARARARTTQIRMFC